VLHCRRRAGRRDAGISSARAGVEVTVLEKHKGFFRDFRGDTIHPSTLEVMHELGLLEELLCLPHDELRGIEAHFGDRVLHLADLAHLPTHCKFIAFMPQWDFLNFLSRHGQKFPQFRLRMETEVTDLLLEKWPGSRCESEHAGGYTRAPCRIGGGGGWPEFDGARPLRARAD
jgi:2-polyprenyl-6-methoxyphenol hydroxylase-like FAD-dependent oxidoreductase